MRHKHFVLALAALGALTLLPQTTRADNLSFAFTPTTYTASAGSVVTLMGTFTNGAGAITFTGYDASLQTGLSLFPNGNFGSQPFDALPGLASNQTLGPVALFNVMIAAGTPNGTVFTFANNQFTIFYDPSTVGTTDQAAASFQIVVQNQQLPGVPEPTTLLLFATGLSGVIAKVRRRQRNPPQAT